MIRGVGDLIGIACIVALTAPASAQRDVQAHVPGAPPHSAAVAAALRQGELYDNVLRDAWAGDSSAVGFLLSYTGSQRFHSRTVAAQHAAVIAALLRQIGDERFAAGLRNEYPSVQSAVLAAIDHIAPSLVTAAAFPRTDAFRKRPPVRPAAAK